MTLIILLEVLFRVLEGKLIVLYFDN